MSALVTVFGIAALPAGSASAAATPVTTPITPATIYQVVADSAHGHLFFSEGKAPGTPTRYSGTNSILVTDTSGKTVTTINGLSGVKGIALSPDGSTLYAALSGADAITAISTSTLQPIVTYNLGSAYSPYNLTFEDGLLWIGYETPSNLGGVGYLDRQTSDAPVVTPVLSGEWPSPPSISGDPDSASAASATGTLVAAGSGATPTEVDSLQVSGGTVTSSASAQIGGSCAPQNGLNVLPGGSQFVLDCPSEGIYSTADPGAGPAASYPVSSDVSATAVAPDGTVAVGYAGDKSVNNGAGVDTFAPGSVTPDPSAGYTIDNFTSYTADVTWSADSSELFAVIAHVYTDNIVGYSLQTLYPPTPWLMPLPLSLAASALTIPYQGKITLTASLPVSNDTTAHTVSIYETPAGGQRKLYKTITLSSGESTSMTVGPLATTTLFTASADGDSDYAAVTTSGGNVRVKAKVTGTIAGWYGSKTVGGQSYRLYHHTGTLKINAAVAPNKAGECVKFQFQHYNGTTWKPVATSGCAALGSASTRTVTRPMSMYSVGGRYRVRVDYIPSSTDTRNLTNDSGWLYYLDEK